MSRHRRQSTRFWFALTLPLALAGLLLSSNAATARPLTLQPNDTLWSDTGSNPLAAHNGGVIRVGSTYYWIGDVREHSGVNAFHGFNCYSSPNLRDWTFVADVLPPGSGNPTTADIATRPHVVYNDATQNYVMYFKTRPLGTKGTENKAGVATSSSVCGQYTYLGAQTGPSGEPIQDLTLFKDPGTDAAYLVNATNLDGVQTVEIVSLSSDYLSMVAKVSEPGGAREAPVLFTYQGVYYLITSARTGWAPNQAEYQSASSLTSTWSAPADFGDTDCSEQGTAALVVTGTSRTTPIFIADDNIATDLASSPYVWNPITVDTADRQLTLNCLDSWSIDLHTGHWRKSR